MSRKQLAYSKIDLDAIDPVLKDFLNKQSAKSQKTYGCMMKKLYEFTHGESGAQMLKEKKLWETKKIHEFRDWIEKQGYGDSYRATATAMVRGFFTANRKPLNLTRQEKRRLDTRERSDEDYLFSRDDISKMATIGSIKEKYVLLVGVSVGLRAEDFGEITYGHYRSLNLDAEPPIALGEYRTRKEKVKAYPFLSSDAIPIVKTILEANKNPRDDDRVWNENPAQLTIVLQNLFKHSGLHSGGKLVRFHNLRKYLTDMLSAEMSESKWKQIVGKKISEGAYVSSRELREGYIKAMPNIVVMANGKLKADVEKTKADVERANVTVEELVKRLNEKDKIIEKMMLDWEKIKPLVNRIDNPKVEKALRQAAEEERERQEGTERVKAYEDEEKVKHEISDRLGLKKKPKK